MAIQAVPPSAARPRGFPVAGTIVGIVVALALLYVLKPELLGGMDTTMLEWGGDLGSVARGVMHR